MNKNLYIPIIILVLILIFASVFMYKINKRLTQTEAVLNGLLAMKLPVYLSKDKAGKDTYPNAWETIGNTMQELSRRLTDLETIKK